MRIYPKVTAALLARQGRLLIAQRPSDKRFGLRWEFPGGKVEPREGLKESLAREIREELCLDVAVGHLFRLVKYRADDFGIDLYAYWCSISGGELRLREHVAVEWVFPEDLGRFDLTQADRVLVPFLLALPELPEATPDSAPQCRLP